MRGRVIAITMAASVTVVAAAIAAASDSHDGHQTEIAQAGATVMPFDLDLTTHRFQKASYGGVQTVVADNPQDAKQVTLIKQHLSKEVNAFQQGDFGDPKTIHGADMPGVATLESNSQRLRMELKHRQDGASIVFRTQDKAVREALHAWFDAQVRDHGAHAEHT